MIHGALHTQFELALATCLQLVAFVMFWASLPRAAGQTLERLAGGPDGGLTLRRFGLLYFVRSARPFFLSFTLLSVSDVVLAFGGPPLVGFGVTVLGVALGMLAVFVGLTGRPDSLVRPSFRGGAVVGFRSSAFRLGYAGVGTVRAVVWLAWVAIVYTGVLAAMAETRPEYPAAVNVGLLLDLPTVVAFWATAGSLLTLRASEAERVWPPSLLESIVRSPDLCVRRR